MSPEIQNEEVTNDLSIQVQPPVNSDIQTDYREDSENYDETSRLLPPDENSQKQIEQTTGLKNKRGRVFTSKAFIRSVLLTAFIVLIVVLLVVCIIKYLVFSSF
jgi:hypothetical protein